MAVIIGTGSGYDHASGMAADTWHDEADSAVILPCIRLSVAESAAILFHMVLHEAEFVVMLPCNLLSVAESAASMPMHSDICRRA